MTHNSLKAELWRFILIPAVTIILVLATTLSILFLSQLHRFVEFHGTALAQKTAQLSALGVNNNNPELLLETLLASTLDEPFVRAVALHLPELQESLHLGPSFRPYKITNKAVDYRTPAYRETVDTLRFIHPLDETLSGTDNAWVEIEIITSPFIVLHYHTLLITTVVTVLSLVLSILLAMRLQKNLGLPFNRIRTALDYLAAGRLTERVEPQQSREFNELADATNSLAVSLEQAQQEMQVNIEQATEDLRETLETIEIQNIELNMARKEALEASRIKSEFLANTSHEIRTPLNGILGFTNLALKTELNEQQQEYLNTIRNSSQNLLTVINDILDFSKIEAGKLTLDFAPLPLRRTVDETISHLAPDAHEKNLQLITLMDPELPPHLLGDSLRFKQVLSNLLGNAIKFSPQGNILLEIRQIARTDSQVTLRVSVSDEGIGLTNEQKSGLFNAFAQVDMSNTRQYGGTGLGLAICKGLVERMGGEIGVDSQPEQGSRFWFTARLNIDKHAPRETVPGGLRQHRVLVCSDNSASSQQLQELLASWHMESQAIIAVHDIFTHMRTAQKEKRTFSAVLIDIAPDERKMPPPLLENLSVQLGEEFGCKVIACCTQAHQRLFRTHSQAMPVVFVNKPVAYDNLLQALARQLNVSLTTEKSARPVIPQHNEKKPPEILVVDDNPANLQLASELLRELNVQVTPASNGKEALEQCHQKTFDLIFMDIQMPGMDGIETTRRLREQSGPHKRVPIIALTAHTLTEQKADLLIAGMDDCLSKPVNENQLVHMINRWVRLDGSREPVVKAYPLRDESLFLPEPDIDNQISPVDIRLSLKLANNKPALARDMLIMLVDNLSADQQAIALAYEQKDYPALEELVHRLYGSSCYCGVPHLKNISGLLDKLLQKRSYEQLDSAINSLNNAIDSILEWAYQRDIKALFELNA